MKKIKTLYLVSIITIGLIGLGIGSTYAMFTTSVEINNPISISTTLTSESDIIETFDITVEAGSNKEIPITINNISSSNLNYSVWYITNASDVKMGTKLSNSDSSPSSSVVTGGQTKKVYVQIKNNTDNSITVTLGVSPSTSNVVLSSSMTIVPNTELIFGKNLAEYITNLYLNNSKTEVRNYNTYYNYAKNVNLMSDRFGGVSSNYDDGNIRYYGASPNNYVYFNCSDYSNQNTDNCELWRIIGVFDGKVKITRNEIIGKRAWYDNANSGYNNWSITSINQILNTNYLNRTQLAGTSILTSEIGIYENTRNLIFDTIWELRGPNSTLSYSDEFYLSERTSSGSVHNGNPERWPDTGTTTSWPSKIGLLYPSDYGFAADFINCSLGLTSSGYKNSCAKNNWIYSLITSNGTNSGWLITPRSGDDSSAFNITTGGDITYSNTYYTMNILPTLYLVSNISISDEIGDGSSSNPFQIVIE